MNSIVDSTVIIQTCSHSVPSTPSWFGEAVLIIEHLRKQGILSKLSEHVRFPRRRFGHYEVIDFLAVLFGYAISGERTLEAFYQRLQPFAVGFMALFERDRLPARSTLSRFLTVLTEAPVEALRRLFLDDLLSRPLSKEKHTGDLMDREGVARIVFDVDGTREAARQRALPQTEELPPAFRRLGDLCAPGYTGRKRGEIVRTRTVINQVHSSQWLGSFGNRGNGLYRTELRQARAGLASHGKGLSTSSSSPACPNRASPLRMSWNCICIVVPLSRLLQMRMLNKIRIAGVVSHPVGRSAGRSWRNGFGTCVWNWGISFILIRCAPPSLPLPVCRRTKTRPTPPLLHKDMGHQRWLCPGKRAASLVEILPSSQMGRCVAQQGNR
jgi:hypothetical protein